MKQIYLILLLVVIVSTNTLAQTQPSCSAAGYKQFDFWAGNWNVYGKDSLGNEKLIGTNLIEKKQDDCMLQENWTASQGNNTGTSINFYNATDSTWNQVWVSNTGNILKLQGKLEGNSMVLYSQEMISRAGQPYVNRITWTPNEDGSVRQHWEVSGNKEKWQTVFDGLYRRQNTP